MMVKHNKSNENLMCYCLIKNRFSVNLSHSYEQIVIRKKNKKQMDVVFKSPRQIKEIQMMYIIHFDLLLTFEQIMKNELHQ
jgi:hypothetical protein